MGTISIQGVSTIQGLKDLTGIEIGSRIYVDDYDANILDINSEYKKVATVSQVDDGGGTIIGGDSSVYELIINNDKVTASQYGLRNDNTLLLTSQIENFLKYCALNSYIAYFNNGTYLFAYDFEIEILTGNVIMNGEDENLTIITSDNSDINTFRKPQKIDLTIDPATYTDGVYYVFGTQIANDGTNNYHASYPANMDLNYFRSSSKDNYIEIVSGVPTAKTQAQIQAMNWVSYLDLSSGSIEPVADGIYECSIAEWLISGVIQPIQLPWEAGLNPTQGSAVINNSGTWTRYSPKLGIQFYEDIKVRNIKFNKCSFFLFNFLGLTPGRIMDIQFNKFENIRRIIATDRSAFGWFGMSLNNKSVKDGLNYNFDLVNISNNDFDRIGEGVFWGTPTIYESKFNNNNYVDCDNLVSVFNQLHWLSTSQDIINYYHDNAIGEIKNNTHRNCLNMSVDIGQPQKQWYRFISNTLYDNNKFYNSNGVACFSSQTNNRISNNYFDSFCDIRSSLGSGALIIHKLAPTEYKQTNIIENNVVKQHYSHFFYIDFDNEYEIRNNEYTNMTYIEFCYSLTTQLDRNIVYRVFDLATFQSVAIGKPFASGDFIIGQEYTIKSIGDTDFTLIGASANTIGIKFTATGIGTGTGTAYKTTYDDTIVYNDLVRYNYQQKRWIVSEAFPTVREVYGKDVDMVTAVNLESINSSNNKYRANGIIRITGEATDRTKASIYINNDDYKINAFFPVAIDQPIEHMSIKNTTIRVTVGSSTSPNSMCRNKLTLENIIFELAYSARLYFEHDEDVLFNNIRIIPFKDFYTEEFQAEFPTSSPVNQETIQIITSGVGKKLTIENGEYHIGMSRNIAIRGNGFNKYILNRPIFNMTTLNDLTAYHNGYGFRTLNDCDLIEIKDSSIIVNDQGKESFLVDSFTGTLVTLNLFNNKIEEFGDLEAIIGTAGRVITNLNISQKALLPSIKADPYNGATITTLNEI